MTTTLSSTALVAIDTLRAELGVDFGNKLPGAFSPEGQALAHVTAALTGVDTTYLTDSQGRLSIVSTFATSNHPSVAIVPTFVGKGDDRRRYLIMRRGNPASGPQAYKEDSWAFFGGFPELETVNDDLETARWRLSLELGRYAKLITLYNAVPLVRTSYQRTNDTRQAEYTHACQYYIVEISADVAETILTGYTNPNLAGGKVKAVMAVTAEELLNAATNGTLSDVNDAFSPIAIALAESYWDWAINGIDGQLSSFTRGQVWLTAKAMTHWTYEEYRKAILAAYESGDPNWRDHVPSYGDLLAA